MWAFARLFYNLILTYILSYTYIHILQAYVMFAQKGFVKRIEEDLGSYWVDETIFIFSIKAMTQWKCFDKSHYTKAEPVWLQRALLHSMIISLRESIPSRRKQPQWLCICSDYCLLFSKVRPLVPQLQRVIFKSDSPFFTECTLRVNEALYQQSTSSIHVYNTDCVLFTPWAQSQQLYGCISLHIPS